MKAIRHALPALAALGLLTALPSEGRGALPTPHAVQLRAAQAGRVWPAVRRGDSDQTNFRVTLVQYLLRAHGVSVPADGRFGPQTQRAVRAFQRSHGLPQTGVVANRTWEKLIVPLSEGSGGDAVRAAQTVLREVAEPRVTRDGRFGARTAQAVRAFQKTSGLKVDSVVGPATWLALTANFLD